MPEGEQMIELLDIDGSGSGVFVSIFGVESTHYRSALLYEEDMKMQERRMRNDTPDDRVRDTCRRLSMLMYAWRTEAEDYNDPTIAIGDDSKLPCTRENAERLLNISAQIRGQIESAVFNTQGFLNG